MSIEYAKKRSLYIPFETKHNTAFKEDALIECGKSETKKDKNAYDLDIFTNTTRVQQQTIETSRRKTKDKEEREKKN